MANQIAVTATFLFPSISACDFVTPKDGALNYNTVYATVPMTSDNSPLPQRCSGSSLTDDGD